MSTDSIEKMNIEAIMEEFKKIDKDHTMKVASEQLIHMVEHNTPKQIASMLAFSTAFYTIFHDVLDKLSILQAVDNLLNVIEKMKVDPEPVVPKGKDVN